MNEENKITYFEIVDLVDKIFPPKSTMDYRELSNVELADKCEQAIRNSGYNFTEKQISNAREIVLYHQKNVTGRNSNYTNYNQQKNEKYDQNNVFIQDKISNMKIGVIYALSNNIELIKTGKDDERIDESMGKIPEIRQRMSKEKIKEYLTEVITVSFENNNIELPTDSLTKDIMLHFGLSTNSEYYKMINSTLTNIENYSTTPVGRMDSDGNYEGSYGHLDRFQEISSIAIMKLADKLAALLDERLTKGEEYNIKREKAIEERKKKKNKAIEQNEITQEQNNNEIIPELEELKKEYEKKQELLLKSYKIKEEILLRKKRMEMIQEEINKFEQQLNENNDIMTK